MGRKIKIPREFIKVGLQFHNNPSVFKFFDVYPQFDKRIALAVKLGLDKGEKKEILDIGAGAGMWAFILSELGHKITITDIPLSLSPTIKSYEKGIKALGLKKSFDLVLTKRQKMRLPQKYDLITITGAIFFSGWKKKDWLFFIQDATDNLKKNGSLFIHLNTLSASKLPFEILANMPIRENWKWMKSGCGLKNWLLIRKS